MGKVLQFITPQDRVRRPGNAEGVARRPCEIVILPCVRYERGEAAVNALPPGKSAPQKKRKSRRRRARSR